MADSRSSGERQPSFWREYRFEILWLIAVLLGVFLLVERVNIRATLRHGLMTVVRVILGGVSHTSQLIIAAVPSTTISDAIGMGLIVIATGAMLWRLRWRVMHSPRLARPVCPVCGSGLHRIHRHQTDRIIALFVPVKRYLCKNPECRWSGLRVGTSAVRSRRRRKR